MYINYRASFNNNASPMKNKTLAEDTSPEGDGYVNEDSFDFNVTLEIKLVSCILHFMRFIL